MNRYMWLCIALVVLVFSFFLISGEVKARTEKMLRGTTYTTPLGDPVEILDVPGFGKCLFSSAYVICK